jgi:hypothetical protein
MLFLFSLLVGITCIDALDKLIKLLVDLTTSSQILVVRYLYIHGQMHIHDRILVVNKKSIRCTSMIEY